MTSLKFRSLSYVGTQSIIADFSVDGLRWEKLHLPADISFQEAIAYLIARWTELDPRNQLLKQAPQAPDEVTVITASGVEYGKLDGNMIRLRPQNLAAEYRPDPRD